MTPKPQAILYGVKDVTTCVLNHRIVPLRADE